MFLVMSQVDVLRRILQDVRELLGVMLRKMLSEDWGCERHPVIGLRYL